MAKQKKLKLDFQNTEYAFEYKSYTALKKASWLFGMMNSKTLVSLGSTATLIALKLRMPILWAIKNTIFEHFCGGTTLLESKPVIEKMAEYSVTSMLDYGTEAKNSEEDFNRTMREIISAIHFANKNESVSVVVMKLTGLMPFNVLEKLHAGKELTKKESDAFVAGKKRVDSVCHLAMENKVKMYVDAEESWIQNPIDTFVLELMERYNKEEAIVYNTFQMYRHDRLAYLKNTFNTIKDKDFIIGAKLVRGAYMNKEAERAEEKNYPSPIQPSKEATDKDYDKALKFCFDNIDKIAFCAATHNADSCEYLTGLIVNSRTPIPRNHPHIIFCQLYGMSDNLTFNLSRAGFIASKYLVYGPVRDVMPYLVRRAQENTAVTGDMSRELVLIKKELKRRRQVKR
jgi:proline dehydrogenase